jgi:hypothetical protein
MRGGLLGGSVGVVGAIGSLVFGPIGALAHAGPAGTELCRDGVSDPVNDASDSNTPAHYCWIGPNPQNQGGTGHPSATNVGGVSLVRVLYVNSADSKY